MNLTTNSIDIWLNWCCFFNLNSNKIILSEETVSCVCRTSKKYIKGLYIVLGKLKRMYKMNASNSNIIIRWKNFNYLNIKWGIMLIKRFGEEIFRFWAKWAVKNSFYFELIHIPIKTIIQNIKKGIEGIEWSA